MVALAGAALLLPGGTSSSAAAEGPIVIRYASLAPSSSAFGKILKVWGREFKQETEGRAELRFYTGGSQGDERAAAALEMSACLAMCSTSCPSA